MYLVEYKERLIMMEKRNFVTAVRTPAEGAADIDEVLDAGAKAFGHCLSRTRNSDMEKKASVEDEKSDKGE